MPNDFPLAPPPTFWKTSRIFPAAGAIGAGGGVGAVGVAGVVGVVFVFAPAALGRTSRRAKTARAGMRRRQVVPMATILRGRAGESCSQPAAALAGDDQAGALADRDHSGDPQQ